MCGIYQYVIIIGATERYFKGCHECLIMKTRFLKKKDRSAQFYYKTDEKFYWPKILIVFLTCKKNLLMNYKYKTSPCTVIEMSSLTCVPSFHSFMKLGMPFGKIFVWWFIQLRLWSVSSGARFSGLMCFLKDNSSLYISLHNYFS